MTAPLTAHRTGSTTLADDREISWAIFGDPEGDTVFWFHGTPGARAQLPHDIDQVATANKLRIITVERPGTGDSTTHAYARIIDFTRDLHQITVDLGIDEFGVVGLSGGGPYLLATAHEFGDRMKVGIVLGGVGPTRGADAVVSHTLLLVPAAKLLWWWRTPLGNGLSKLVRLATPYADTAVDLFFNLVPGDREAFRERPLDRRQFTHDLIDANRRSGLRSPIDDLILFGRHWGFELGDVEVPIVFFGGNSDVIVPYLHAERQAKRVPGARLRTFEGRGHFAGYTSPEAVLGDIRELWPVAPAKKAAPAKKTAAKKAAAKKTAPAKTTAAKKAAPAKKR